MPSPGVTQRIPSLRVVFGVLALLLLCAGCSGHNSGNTSTEQGAGSALHPVSPSLFSVNAGRFVQSIDVGGKALVVTPPPQHLKPSVTFAKATALFEADYDFKGTFSFALVGLGTATIDESAIQTTSFVRNVVSSTTTTAPPATTTTSAPTTTTTTAPPPTTTPVTTPPTSTPTTESPTTAPNHSTTTSSPPVTTPTTTPASSLPVYDKRVAWIGIAVAQGSLCSADSPSAVAVVIDASTGGDVVSVTATGCDTAVSTEDSKPDELESIAWEPTGPSSTAVVAQIPPCGRYVGWTNTYENGVAFTEVEAAAPYDPDCGSTAYVPSTINLVVPLGSTNVSPPHASGGPIDNLDVLPSSVPSSTSTSS